MQRSPPRCESHLEEKIFRCWYQRPVPARQQCRDHPHPRLESPSHSDTRAMHFTIRHTGAMHFTIRHTGVKYLGLIHNTTHPAQPTGCFLDGVKAHMANVCSVGLHATMPELMVPKVAESRRGLGAMPWRQTSKCREDLFPQHTNIWSTQLLVDYAASRDKQHVRERLSRHDDRDPPHTHPGNMYDKL